MTQKKESHGLLNFMIQKATELGVKSIQPLLLDRCIKTKLNYSRAEKIIISAAKQSGRSFFPVNCSK